ncbi:MAG: exsB protein [Myxococcales bacterium]|nr:exsB protein [Myxococcales bacterium]
MRSAIVLLSGGLDSATVAAVARRDGYAIHAISFRYGQRHAVEVAAAERVARHLRVTSHRTIELDLRAMGGSALTADIDVPKGRSGDEMSNNIPSTYVPARNTIFLSHALGFAEVIGARDIFIGVNALDYSGYPDCRPAFVSAFEHLANLATKAGVDGSAFKLHAPLISMSKAEIIRLGISLGVDYGVTSSCYDPTADGKACGQCDSCHLRLRGFAENQLADPIHYVGRAA